MFWRSSRRGPDCALVACTQEGDLPTFEEVVALHSQRVYRKVLAIIANREEAGEASQDTLAFVYINDFEHHSKFTTWLMTITGNTALQYLRGRQPVESVESESADSSKPAWGSLPKIRNKSIWR